MSVWTPSEHVNTAAWLVLIIVPVSGNFISCNDLGTVCFSVSVHLVVVGLFFFSVGLFYLENMNQSTLGGGCKT